MVKKHNVDPLRTGTEICREIIELHLKSCGLPDAENHAASIMDQIIGNNFPLAVIQQGHLSDMLDAAEENVKENKHLRSLVNELRKHIGAATS